MGPGRLTRSSCVAMLRRFCKQPYHLDLDHAADASYTEDRLSDRADRAEGGARSCIGRHRVPAPRLTDDFEIHPWSKTVVYNVGRIIAGQ